VLLGLAALARANILAVWPVAVVWVWLQAAARRRGLTAAAVLTTAVAITVSPATLHNRIAGGQWAIISANFAENWQIGNSYGSTGTFVYPEGELMPVASADWLKLQARKGGLLLADYEQPNNVNFYQLADERPWLAPGYVLSWGMFLALGIAGVWLTRRGWRKLFPLYGYVLLYGGTIVLFFVTSRFRVPLWPVLILFSAAGIDRAVVLWNDRHRLEPALVLGLAAALATGLIAANPRTVQPRYWESLAQVHEKRGEWQAAETAVRRQLGSAGDDRSAVWKLAYYLQRQGEYGEAAMWLERLLVLTDNRPDILREAGLNDIRLGRYERGADRLRGYIEAWPDTPDSARIAEIIETVESRK
jgi:hypothetical protein